MNVESQIVTLDTIQKGQTAKIRKVSGRGPLRRRLMDMGLTTGTSIQMVKAAPLGDPIEYQVRGYRLTLRKSEANTIQVEILNLP